MKEKRLSKALAAAGVASRRACEEIIFAGRVQVNGTTVRIPQTLIDWDRDQIYLDGAQISCEEKKCYYLLNKPPGYLCSNSRPGKQRIILDLFPDHRERLFTVDRLDRNSSGLILITNDGRFAQAVIHPSSGITKEYVVKVLQEITPEHLETLSQGARVDDRWIRPVSVRKVRRGTFKICVNEGRKHEVRLIAERAGLKIVELKRVRIGSLVLGSLGEGEYRSLTEEERSQLAR